MAPEVGLSHLRSVYPISTAKPQLWLLSPGPAPEAGLCFFVAALICSLTGDVLLMLPSDLFVAGLAAFLAGHLCYLVGFWTHGPSARPLVLATGVVVVLVAHG